MAADRLETETAVNALTWRLRDWGVDEPGVKARLFMDELTKRGWQPHPTAQLRRPPRAGEQCATHPGEYAGSGCRCCASERLSPQEELGGRPGGMTLADARKALAAATLCVHRVAPDACGACRLATPARPATSGPDTEPTEETPA